jgi:16S rRNA (uracil1498-N3)-methyltransferase
MGRVWRVYHPDLPRAEGAEVLLSREEAHHAGRVLRLGPGDPLNLFDGRGREWVARVVEQDGGRITVRLERECDESVEAPCRITIFQGLCRADRMEWLIQKATEIGVNAVHPVATARGEGRPPGPAKMARWRRIAVEAAKQSGRRVVPSIESHDALPAMSGTPGLVLDTAEGIPPLGAFLVGNAPPALHLAVGPEGGFDPAEVTTAVERGWTRASLGPRTLRAETAALVAAAAVLHVWGDLGSSRDPSKARHDAAV